LEYSCRYLWKKCRQKNNLCELTAERKREWHKTRDGSRHSYKKYLIVFHVSKLHFTHFYREMTWTAVKLDCVRKQMMVFCSCTPFSSSVVNDTSACYLTKVDLTTIWVRHSGGPPFRGSAINHNPNPNPNPRNGGPRNGGPPEWRAVALTTAKMCSYFATCC